MVYIGSTIQSLSMRMVGHRKDYKSYLNGKRNYISSFEIIQYGDAYIELIKLYPCSCKTELEREEGQNIRVMNCVNKRIIGRTKQEYYKDNKEYTDNKAKNYYSNNKEKRDKQRKEKFNCECGGRYIKCNEKRHNNTKKHQKYLNEKI